MGWVAPRLVSALWCISVCMVQHSKGTAKMRRRGIETMRAAAIPCASACIFFPPMAGDRQMQAVAGRATGLCQAVRLGGVQLHDVSMLP